MEILKSPAKINLGLWVLARRTDNYHEIYTVMQKIDLYDRIFISPAPKLKIEFSNPSIPEENTIYKAVKLFEEITGIEQNLHIKVEKNIPTGSGLGGGSSNAAAILQKLNQMAGSPLSQEELKKIASYIGADVPFFLEEGLAVVEGIGDKITCLNTKLDQEIFIIYPNVEARTSEIYRKVSPEMLTSKEQINIIDNLLKQNKVEEFLTKIHNTLGEIARETYPVINEVLNTLEFLGYKGYITGSGSAVYSFGKPDKRIEDICKLRNWKLIRARFI